MQRAERHAGTLEGRDGGLSRPLWLLAKVSGNLPFGNSCHALGGQMRRR